MSLIPTLTETLARARADLRMGLPVVIGDHLAAAAETITSGRMAAMLALGPAVLAITGWRAETLKARVYDGDIARIEVPADADAGWPQAMAAWCSFAAAQGRCSHRLASSFRHAGATS